MRRLLRTKDILLLTMAGIGDLFQEVRDPLEILSTAYKQMYGFVPGMYARRNFSQAVWRSLKTGDIEKVIKNNKAYLVLTTNGREKVRREFPLTRFSGKWNKKWVILIFDIDEKSRKARNRLREKLKNIGFGMLQKSVWITPLPIAGELTDFVKSNNLTDYVFILEVGDVILGESKELARKVWNLDKLEEIEIELEKEKIETENHLRAIDDRLDNRDGLKLSDKQKEIKKKQMELMLSFPFFYKELLPSSLSKLL